MKSASASVGDYIKNLPDDRRKVFSELKAVIEQNLPPGFQETMSYGMPSFVVPHSIYPSGYHCDPKQALPFISIASQKNFIAVYHMGLYANEKLLKWFQDEYVRQVKGKLDMGKSCIRFKKPEQIPFKLLGDLASRMTVEEWIKLYEKNLKR